MDNLSRPILILLRGGLGSGKTTVGRLIRDSLPPAISISFNIFHSFLSKNPIQNKSLTFEAILNITEFFLKKNFSVILDELFVFPETIKPFLKLGGKYHIPVFLFELQVPVEEAFERYRLQGVKEVQRENIHRISNLLLANPISQAQKIGTHQYSPTQIKDLILESISENFPQND